MLMRILIQSIGQYEITSLKYVYKVKLFKANSSTASFVLLTQYCAGYKIEKNEMGWACGAHG